MRLLLILIISLFSFQSYANHIVGGEVFYDNLGGNNYRISIVVYRDCFSSGAQYDDPLSLGIFTSSNQLVQNIMIPFTGSQNVPITFSNPCVVAPTDICTEKTTYSTIVNLPPCVGGYTLTYQRCCRGAEVANIVSPDNTGLTLTSHIPGVETSFAANSSPRFSNYPPSILCNNEDLVFNHSASDPDGDQLVYSLVAPYSGGSSSGPMPSPPPSPPYSPVVWGSTFTSSNPLGPGASISINPTTGILSASPLMVGLFVVGIRVQEFRNGVVVGETIRDFLFKVINCEITLQAIVPAQEDMDYFESYCQGLTVTFDNNTFGATNYSWDFGVANITSDVSTQFEPTYTFPAQGTYQVMLVANPGWPCSDTAVQMIIVNEFLDVSFTSNDSICINGNSFNFNGAMVGSSSTTFLWDFGSNASISSSTNLDVNNVVFNTSGFIPITLTGHVGTCNDVFTDSIYIYSMPIAAFSPPQNYLCEGLTVSFSNTSTNSFNYLWNFGVENSITDVSTLVQPTYIFPYPGSFPVSLITGSNGTCIDTITHTLVINEILDVSFTSNDSLCITNNSFNFDGSMIGSPTTTYSWFFGSNASTPSANTLDVNNVVYNTAGSFPVTLNANYGTCTDSYTSTIFIFKESTIDFGIAPGPQCLPFMAQFIDLCTSDTPLLYTWNFGDGGTSIVANPSYIYNSIGSFDVTLSIIATAGCVDTFTMTKFALVNVSPRPTSDFTVTPAETDICHSMIQFTDQSIGGVSAYYLFDGNAFSTELNPIYSYLDDGTFYPTQIITNEFGCTDTSSQKIYIEPFMVYFPNAFTPDGDKFNNEFGCKINLEILEWDFRVFNRWGEEVFRTSDPKEGWDGNFLGKPSQDGLYTYKVHYVSCEISDAMHNVTGHFSLLR